MKRDYSQEWFRDRAFKSLKKIGDGVWDFSDSLLLYAPGAEKEYELIQHIENPYYQLVTKVEREYLEEISSNLVSELPKEFEYIDLGPGTEHKEQFIFDESKRQDKKFTYAPVDINEKFLLQSSSYASQQNIPVHPYNVPFEELSTELQDSVIPRFVTLLGLTYSNYEPEVILPLLETIAGNAGLVFIDSQVRNRVDMDEIQGIYEDNLQAITRRKLRLLGLDFDINVAGFFADDGIRAWCVLKNSTPKLELLGITKGTKLLVFQSLRTTKESLEEDVSNFFSHYKLFNTRSSFVGALLWN